MTFYIGVTDEKWFEFLRDRNADEVNFWRPSSKAPFRAPTGGLLLWKLHAPSTSSWAVSSSALLTRSDLGEKRPTA
jgi:hypothetical protein